MVKFFTDEYASEILKLLRANEEFKEDIKDLDVSLMLAVTDKNRAYKIILKNGEMDIKNVPLSEKAIFKLNANLDEWIKLAKGEEKIVSAIMGRKLNFEGSLKEAMQILEHIKGLMSVFEELAPKTEF